MSKTDRKEIEAIIEHVETDISYGGGGTFNKMDADNTFDEKEAARVRRGIRHLRWILKTYLDD